MSNGICIIDLPEKGEIRFRFGMPAVQIFSEKSLKEYFRLLEKTKSENPEIAEKDLESNIKISDFKTASYIVYAGLCNEAEANEKEFPTYLQAYELTEEINYYTDLTKKVLDAFNNSRATEEMHKRLNGSTDTGIKKKQKRTG